MLSCRPAPRRGRSPFEGARHLTRFRGLPLFIRPSPGLGRLRVRLAAADSSERCWTGTDETTIETMSPKQARDDPIDWVNGWPTVNGGAGASDTTMPARAAQEGQRSRYHTHPGR